MISATSHSKATAAAAIRAKAVELRRVMEETVAAIDKAVGQTREGRKPHG